MQRMSVPRPKMSFSHHCFVLLPMFVAVCKLSISVSIKYWCWLLAGVVVSRGSGDSSQLRGRHRVRGCGTQCITAAHLHCVTTAR